MDFLAVIDEFKRGVLDLDCKKMELCRNKPEALVLWVKAIFANQKKASCTSKVYVASTENVTLLS